MAESTVEMKQSGPSAPTLDVSVSFGRFQSDSLSWEKWSSFSPNKYLEEVEKCSTPGSVAQKKAYFEAHYKKIAARKAEQPEQEKQMETNPFADYDEDGEDCVRNSPEMGSKASAANGKISAEELEQSSNSAAVVSGNDFGESKGQAIIIEVCQSTSADGAHEKLDNLKDSLESGMLREASPGQENTHLNGLEDDLKLSNVLLQDATHPNGSQASSEVASTLDQENTHLNVPQGKIKSRPQPPSVQESDQLNGSKGKVDQPMRLKKMGKTLAKKKDDSKLDTSKKPQKVRNSAEIKKKATSPLVKSPQVSTPRISKPMSTSMVLSSSRSSTMKPNGTPFPRSKTPATDSNRVAPSSLHMSLSLGPANSDPSSFTTTRKSLIMEKMGDKDIVKRAFRTFQYDSNQFRSPGDEKSTHSKQISATKMQQKVSSSVTSQKENNSIRKVPEKIDAQRSPSGSKGYSKLSGLLKAPAVDQRKAKPAPSLALRNNDRAEIQKELGKKSEEKSSKQEGKAPFCPKPKEEEKAEMSKPRQTHMPHFCQGKRTIKNLLDMEGAKNEKRH